MTLTYQPYLGKTVVFCLPGSSYSGRFLVRFTQLMADCAAAGIKTIISQDYSAMVNFARCKVAGADSRGGVKQAPWQGKVKYDYMMWIDSDIVFESKDFFRLLDMNKNIASGWYAQPGGTTPVVERMNSEDFTEHGYFRFVSSDEMSQRTKKFRADYIGFGWVLLKKGVLENLPYPWFAPRIIDTGLYEEICSEDVAFCVDSRQRGYNIWVDPTIRVGHEKIQVL